MIGMLMHSTRQGHQCYCILHDAFNKVIHTINDEKERKMFINSKLDITAGKSPPLPSRKEDRKIKG